MANNSGDIIIRPIGIIRSPYRSKESAPKQGFTSEEVSLVEIYPEYARGIAGIVKGDILDLIYWMDRARRENLWNEGKGKGIFATRGPDRPNAIGISPVEVMSVDINVLEVKYLDALDGSYVLDIRHSLFDSIVDLKKKVI